MASTELIYNDFYEIKAKNTPTDTPRIFNEANRIFSAMICRFFSPDPALSATTITLRRIRHRGSAGHA